jgi:MSHA biogenesis protein MshN
MSLINKMLQDLDARGRAGTKAGGESVRSVAPSGARTPAMLAVRTSVALVALALAVWYGWTEMRKPAFKPPKVLEPSAVVVAPAVPVAPAPAAMAVAESVSAAQDESRAARAERIEARRRQETAPEQKMVDASTPARQADLARELAEAKRKAMEARAQAKALAAAHAAAPAGGDQGARTGAGSGADQRTATAAAPSAASARAAGAGQAQARLAAKAAPAREAEVSGVTVTSQQQGENAYKRALGALQDGRVQDAMASLEQAVFAYPRHDAARQALVGLLLEARRHEEAMRHLQLGLGLDPKQQQMAMLLARLQIERGGPAVETLTRTLPYAGNNPDYLAFLAGALQKGQRHKEAVEQYQAALRLMPQNGVWWMGMGISLQADKRHAEAVDAYQRAKASGSLSPELASFVERKLAQLPR